MFRHSYAPPRCRTSVPQDIFAPFSVSVELSRVMDYNSRSRTVHPQLTPLTLDGTVLGESADLVILGVTFDAKMTF